MIDISDCVFLSVFFFIINSAFIYVKGMNDLIASQSPSLSDMACFTTKAHAYIYQTQVLVLADAQLLTSKQRPRSVSRPEKFILFARKNKMSY